MNFSRRLSTGSSIHSWLAEPGPVYVKRHVRHSKFDPLVEKVDVLQVNPHYAHIRYPDGRETTVSTKHLGPSGHVGHVEAPLQPRFSLLKLKLLVHSLKTTVTILIWLLKLFKNRSLWY